MADRLFTLGAALPSYLTPLAWALDRLTALSRIQDVYDTASGDPLPRPFMASVLDALEISYRVANHDIARIPRTGPLLVVANHPFGAVEGLLISSLLTSVRPDVKVMANYLLSLIPQLKDLFIPVDPFGSKDAVSKNLQPIRQAMRWLGGGKALVMFPAGEVSHFDLRSRGVADVRWNDLVAKLAVRCKATVLPIYIPGGNGPLFHAAGLIHPRLRTALLPRAMLRQSGQTLELRIGSPIPWRKLAEIGSDREITTYLRRRTYMLHHRNPQPPAETPHAAASAAGPSAAAHQPIVAPVARADLAREVADLPPSQLLVNGEGLQAWGARSFQIPSILREIGRLREVTFRATGEGTGLPIDLDDFDEDYVHLFLWNPQKLEIAGAYRLGQADTILRQKGPGGLYTHTLFDYPARLIENLGPSLELGRSFVRLEYQRAHQPLLMLWKAIGRFVVENPRYRMLIGPVSISNSYQSVSQQLMVQFLTLNHRAHDHAPLVKPRSPFRQRRVKGIDPRTFGQLLRDHEDVSDLVADVEPDNKGIPVLLRQYLKLGAQVAAVNVDKSFGDCVDALIVIDLARTDRKLLDRYLTRDGAGSFLSYHARLDQTKLAGVA